REIDLLERLRLDHLRVDLELGDPRYAEELERAVEAAEALGCGLELALFLGADPAAELDDLAGRLAKVLPPVRRALVFREGAAVTPDVDVRLARERLGVPCAGGSNVYFTDVTRKRPDPDSLETGRAP